MSNGNRTIEKTGQPGEYDGSVPKKPRFSLSNSGPGSRSIGDLGGADDVRDLIHLAAGEALELTECLSRLLRGNIDDAGDLHEMLETQITDLQDCLQRFTLSLPEEGDMGDTPAELERRFNEAGGHRAEEQLAAASQLPEGGFEEYYREEVAAGRTQGEV
jgi:hypothetical protein